VRRYFMFSVLVLIALLVISCGPAEITNPPGDASRPGPAKELNGAWFAEGKTTALRKGSCFLHFAQRKDCLIDLILIVHHQDKGANPMLLRGYAASLGKVKYLSLKPMRSIDFAARDKDKFASDYLLLKYAVGEDGTLTLSYFKEDSAQRLIQDGKLEGNNKKITATRKDLEAFLKTKEAEKVFKQLGVFTRVKPNVPENSEPAVTTPPEDKS
jgi:hypothetical protein